MEDSWSNRLISFGSWILVSFVFEKKQAYFQGFNQSDGLRACFFAFKSDLKARYQMHRLSRWYKCNLLFGLYLMLSCLLPSHLIEGPKPWQHTHIDHVVPWYQVLWSVLSTSGCKLSWDLWLPEHWAHRGMESYWNWWPYLQKAWCFVPISLDQNARLPFPHHQFWLYAQLLPGNSSGSLF